MSSCCKSNCSTNANSKSKSNLGFFVAMFFVVALGGTAYLYFDATVFSPVDAQEQTALNNPGVGHPPKSKRPNPTNGSANTRNAAESTPRTDANDDEK